MATCVRVLPAQEIRRSASEVVVQGKNYYLHRTGAGQTLYSIARAYGVSEEEIKKANGKENDALETGEVLLVPRVEPRLLVDGTYYYHVAGAGETLYVLARRFGLRARQITRDNPGRGERDALPPGTIVKISLEHADRAAVARALQQEKAREEETDTLAPVPLLPLVEEPPGAPARVSVLLPFGVDENKLPASLYEIETDDRGLYLHDERWRISPRSEPFLEFYCGMLVAVDSLKRAGYSIALQVLDTRQDTLPGDDLLPAAVNHFAPHLVIGPARADAYARLAARVSLPGAPLVYPLSARAGELWRFPNFVQVNGSSRVLVDAMARWVARRGQEGHILAIIPPGGARGEEGELVDRTRQYLSADEESDNLTLFHWDGLSATTLKELARPEQENIILFPTLDEALASRLLPAISAWAERCRVTVVGFPEWLKFTAVDEETLFKLNLTIFQTTHVDGESARAAAFAREYRKHFHADPSIMAYKGFDQALFFFRHAAIHRERSLEALANVDETGLFTRFIFTPAPGRTGLENRGFFLVNYASSFEIKVTPLNE
jgi:LysM repeat protein